LKFEIRNMKMRMNVLLPVLLLMLDTSPGTVAFSALGAVSHRRTIALNTQLQSSVSKKKKKNKNVVQAEEEELANFVPALPPALSLDGLTCSHDGGTVFQLKDVSYVLPRTAKVGLVGRVSLNRKL
jgi:hypothetical protein